MSIWGVGDRWFGLQRWTAIGVAGTSNAWYDDFVQSATNWVL